MKYLAMETLSQSKIELEKERQIICEKIYQISILIKAIGDITILLKKEKEKKGQEEYNI